LILTNSNSNSADPLPQQKSFFGYAIVDALFGFSIGTIFWFVAFTIAMGASDDGMRGEASIGAGLFFIFVALPVAVVVGIPLGIWLTYILTKGKPFRVMGAVAFYPVALIILANYGTFQEWKNGTGAADGKFSEHLVLADKFHPQKIFIPRSEGCSESCEEFLLEHFSKEVIELRESIDISRKIKDWTATSYRLGAGEECADVDSNHNQFYRRRGIFDLCTVKAGEKSSESLNLLMQDGLLYRSESDDNLFLGIPTVRRNGMPQTSWTAEKKWAPRKIAVANVVQAGRIGAEILRWEYGASGWDEKGRLITEVGTNFRYTDFMRAITGLKTDRIYASSRSNIDQILDRLIVALETLPIDYNNVQHYLFEMLPIDFTRPLPLDSKQKDKFLQIVNLACKEGRSRVAQDTFCRKSLGELGDKIFGVPN
jgi:hypothetical protein